MSRWVNKVENIENTTLSKKFLQNPIKKSWKHRKNSIPLTHIMTYTWPLTFQVWYLHHKSNVFFRLYFDRDIWWRQTKEKQKYNTTYAGQHYAQTNTNLLRICNLCSLIIVVLLCVFTFCVPCCDVRYDFRLKTMLGSSLPPVYCVLFPLFVFVCA
jgi:hypothetical protein